MRSIEDWLTILSISTRVEIKTPAATTMTTNEIILKRRHIVPSLGFLLLSISIYFDTICNNQLLSKTKLSAREGEKKKLLVSEIWYIGRTPGLLSITMLIGFPINLIVGIFLFLVNNFWKIAALRKMKYGKKSHWNYIYLSLRCQRYLVTQCCYFWFILCH